MASGPIVGGDDGAKEKQRYSERKVYTRKAFKGPKKDPNAVNTVAQNDTAAAKNDTATTSAATSISEVDGDNNSAVKNGSTGEPKINSNDVLAQPVATPAEEDGNSVRLQLSSRLEDEDSAQPKVDTREEGGNTAQPQGESSLEEGFLAQPQGDSRIEDGNMAQPQGDSRIEEGNLAQPQVDSRIEEGNSAQPQGDSRLEEGCLAQPQGDSRIEDGNSAQPQVDSRLEEANSAQPQGDSRLEEGNTAQLQVESRLEEGNSAQLQGDSRLEGGNSALQPVESRLEEGNSVQPVESRSEEENSAPQVESRLEEGNSAPPQVELILEEGNSAPPQVESRLEEGNTDQLQVDSRLEDSNSAQTHGDSRLEGGSSQPQVDSRLKEGISAQQQVDSRVEEGISAKPEVHSRLEGGNSAQLKVNSRLDDGNLAQLPVVQVSDDSGSLQHDEHSSLNVQQDDDGPLSPNHRQDAVPSTRDLPSRNGAAELGLEDRIKISLALKSKQEMRELRWKLENELDVVRSLVKRIEVKQGQVSRSGNSNVLVGDRIANGGGAKRAHSEVASAGVPREFTRPLHQLSLSILENSQGVSENVEKEKRTPKANQFYHNSEFLLAKDKFPPAESNKKSKLNWKKQGGGEMGHGLGMGSKFFKSCSSLLEKLMKHKHGWVFNAPVDVEGLGLHDYFSIISHPMDLGTVKSRLNKNWYKSPKEFAEDVRLTFDNAMTYNPKGQDVHIMAEQLSKIFEDRWAIIESDYNREMRYSIDYGAAPAPSPLSRKVPAFPPPSLDMRRILDRSESLARTPRSLSITPSSRTPAPKKPKAKDPNKRDMTFEEKQKLSTNLQSLPEEKLDAIVQIIKRRNSALHQHDDEIEVDIDSVDAETLWELDRFVTNYKKSLSKNKRKAELARARAEALHNTLQKSQDHEPVMVEVPKETQADERNVPPSLPVQGENQADNGSRSSSSSSSSSDSGSSSSDSDSDSSSASGSDAG